MTTRAFYRAATLLPFLGLAVAAAIARPSAELPAGWDWVYPGSLARGVMAYAVLAAWLWVRVDRRPIEEVDRVIWWIPVWYIALGWALMLALSLLRGEVAALLADHGGAIGARAAVHLVTGYGYITLVRFALGRMRRAGHISDIPREEVG
jgi:hypothetical protein